MDTLFLIAFARPALENPDAFFLSKSGECFHMTVTGGKQRAEGPLS
jgi:chromosome segregation protein